MREVGYALLTTGCPDGKSNNKKQSCRQYCQQLLSFPTLPADRFPVTTATLVVLGIERSPLTLHAFVILHLHL